MHKEMSEEIRPRKARFFGYVLSTDNGQNNQKDKGDYVDDERKDVNQMGCRTHEGLDSDRDQGERGGAPRKLVHTNQGAGAQRQRMIQEHDREAPTGESTEKYTESLREKEWVRRVGEDEKVVGGEDDDLPVVVQKAITKK